LRVLTIDTLCAIMPPETIQEVTYGTFVQEMWQRLVR